MANEAHVRIDEGVKRGPRKTPVNSRAARGLSLKPRPEDLGSWKIPPELNPDEVIKQYLTEATTSHIARSYGLSRRALTKWLREQRPKEWKEAQLIRAHVRLENAEDAMEEDEKDALSLAYARESGKMAQFRLQALDEDYRPKQEVTVTNLVQIETVLDGEACQLLGKMLAQSVASNTHCPAPSSDLPSVIDVTPLTP